MTHYAYERITERITALLEQGTVPWHKPWKAKTGWPRNYVSQKSYRGINVFLLSAMSFESPCWLTYRQATELGGNVRTGEKSCPVVFWKPMKIEDKESGKDKTVPLLRLYHVFNVAQCDGLGDTPATTETTITVRPAEVVAGMPKRPVIKHGMTSAFYSPSNDCVGMPSQERFETEDAYFGTLFHELVHSTGHESRLKRSTLARESGYGSDPYSREELIAEMGSAFLCGHAEIIDRTLNNSAAYIQHWLERIKDDKTVIVQVAAQAQKAADFILGRSMSATTEVLA